jgi:hypothetical protein
MLSLIAAAALATTTPSGPGPFTAVAQARATIRIVTAVRLKLDGSPNADAPPARESWIKTADGSALRAKLIEFQ